MKLYAPILLVTLAIAPFCSGAYVKKSVGEKAEIEDAARNLGVKKKMMKRKMMKKVSDVFTPYTQWNVSHQPMFSSPFAPPRLLSNVFVVAFFVLIRARRVRRVRRAKKIRTTTLPRSMMSIRATIL